MSGERTSNIGYDGKLQESCFFMAKWVKNIFVFTQ